MYTTISCPNPIFSPIPAQILRRFATRHPVIQSVNKVHSMWRRVWLLFWKNYRVKQRASSLKRYRNSKQWLFPALVMDVVVPMGLLLLIIQQLCQYNAELVVSDDGLVDFSSMGSLEYEQMMQSLTDSFATTSSSLGNFNISEFFKRPNQVTHESAALLLTALPLLLAQSNQSLAILERPESRVFLQYLNRHYPGAHELGIPSYAEKTVIVPFKNNENITTISTKEVDQILLEMPKRSGKHIYAGFDVRRAAPRVQNGNKTSFPFELMVLFYQKVSLDVSEVDENSQLPKYFSKTMKFNRSMEFPNVLPFQMAFNRLMWENKTTFTYNQGVDVSVYKPEIACTTVDKMLEISRLSWDTFPLDSPLGQSLESCTHAMSNKNLSTEILHFLSNLMSSIVSNDGLGTLVTSTLPKRSISRLSGPLESNIAFYIASFFLWPYIRLVRDVVGEKERQLKEYLMIMGLDAMSLLISWFLLYFLAVVAVALLGTWLLSGSMFAATMAGNVYFFLFLLTFASSVLLFGIAITPIFNQTKTAAACAPLVYFILNAGTFIRSFVSVDAVASSTLLASLLTVLNGISSPVVFVTTLRQILAVDAMTTLVRPITWKTVATPLRLMATQCAGYMLLGWYLENVFPRTYGVQQKWYFIFQPSYWYPKNPDVTRNSECVGLTEMDFDNIDEQMDDTLRETPLPEYLQNFQPSLFVRSLSKTYPNGKVALKNVSFGVRKGEIFGLLGPNGAGKSTTLSILSGMLPPTSGDAYMGGSLSVANDPQAVRKSLSVCFQQNILFDKLTVWEHLSLVCALKTSLGIKTVSEDTWLSTLQQFGLDTKCDALSQTLSGGQKRKLSLILALLDSSRLLLLDEPTAGMDQKSRLDTWDALKRTVTHRAVILTTHSMQEAQALCENIGIVADGKLKCCGSSLFLRNRYGVGYKLTVVHCDEDGGEDKNHRSLRPWGHAWTDRLMTTLKKYIPNAAILSDNKWETRVQLTDGEERHFAALFTELEKMKQAGTIKRYAVAATNLEDVFVRVTESEDVYYHVKDDVKNVADTCDDSVDPVLSKLKANKQHLQTPDDDEELPRWKMSMLQLRALIIKRAKMSFRNKKLLVAQYVWPLSFYAVFMIVAQNVFTLKDPMETVTALPRFANGASLYISSPSALTDSVADIVAQLEQPFNSVVFNKNAETEQAMLDAIAQDDDTTFFAGIFVSEVSWVAENTALSSAITYSLYYNNTVHHSLPVALQRMSQAYCKARSKRENAPELDNCDLIVKRGIFPIDNEIGTGISIDNDGVEVDPDEAISIMQRIVVTFYLLMTMSSIVGFYIGLVVGEKDCGLKRMQYQHIETTHTSLLYWLSNFLFDYMTYTFAVMVFFITLVVFFSSTNSAILAAWLVSMVLFGLSILPSQYLTSLIFSSHSSAQSYMSYISLFQIMAASIVFALSMIPTLCVKVNIASYFLQFLPFYTFGIAMLNVVTVSWAPLRQQCLQMGDGLESESLIAMLQGANNKGKSSVWDWDVAGSSWFTLVASALGYTFLLITIDQYQMYPTEVGNKMYHAWRRIRRYVYYCRYGHGYTEANDDTNCAFDDENPSLDMVRAIQLSKVYNFVNKTRSGDPNEALAAAVVNESSQVMALNNVTFSVEKSDCVALLGVNGSGKSTLFEILTGRIFPTYGKAMIDVYDVTSEARAATAKYGYCPQRNIFYNDLTLREHLELFYRLRCCTRNAVLSEGTVIDDLIRRLDLFPVENTSALHLSGGNRRRLMLALALLCDRTSLLLLDEPSAGVDVVARRLMWRVLHQKRQSRNQTSCLFTTHSMEEAEAVCANAVILLKGKVAWSGSIPELKQRVARGISISVRLDSSSIWNSDEMQFYTEQIRSLLKSKSLTTAGSERKNLPLQLLDEAWELCHGNLYNNGDATASTVSRRKSKAWLAGLRARFQSNGNDLHANSTTADTNTNVFLVVPIIEFVQQWLVLEAFVRLENELFKDEMTARSGEVVLSACHDTVYGSGTHTSGVYQTSCTESFGLAEVFALMEKNKKRFSILEYSINELSLESIFEQFQ